MYFMCKDGEGSYHYYRPQMKFWARQYFHKCLSVNRGISVSVQGSLCPRVSLSRGYISRRVSVGGGGFCPGGSLAEGSLFRMSLSKGSLSGDTSWTKTPRQVWIQDLPRRGRGQLRRLKVADIMKRSRIFAKRKASWGPGPLSHVHTECVCVRIE